MEVCSGGKNSHFCYSAKAVLHFTFHINKAQDAQYKNNISVTPGVLWT